MPRVLVLLVLRDKPNIFHQDFWNLKKSFRKLTLTSFKSYYTLPSYTCYKQCYVYLSAHISKYFIDNVYLHNGTDQYLLEKTRRS